MLKILNVMLDLIVMVRPVLEVVERKDRDQAAQIRRALNSAVLNAGEGAAQRGRRAGNHFCIALGSCREALWGLRACVAWGHVAPLSSAREDRFDHVNATLHRRAQR